MLHVSKSTRVRLGILVGISMLALAALACGVGAQPTATPVPPTPVPPTPVPPTPVPPTPIPPTAEPAGKPTPASGGDVGVLDVVNQSTSTICYLYVSPTDSTEWGNDQLGAEQVVNPGATHTVTDVPVGIYDLRADDCDNNTLAQEFGVEITAAGVTWTLSGETVELTVINSSSVAVCYLYVSPTTSDEWGPDQLGESTIPAGTSFTLSGVEPGYYDMRAETCDGIYIEEYELDLNNNFEYTITD